MTDLRSHVPDWLVTPQVIGAVTVVSLGLLLGSVIALPWFVARLPRDYFVEHEHAVAHSPIRDRGRRRVLRALKNLAGLLLLVAGIAMLVLPGQARLRSAAGGTPQGRGSTERDPSPGRGSSAAL